MNSSVRRTRSNSHVVARPTRGRPIALVLVSVLSVINVGIFAASAARPLRVNAGDPAASLNTNVNVTTKRLKGDRLVRPNDAEGWSERRGSTQERNETRPRSAEPQIQLPSAPSAPDN